MTDITPPDKPLPCQDIEPVSVRAERHSFDHVHGQTPFAVFGNWAHHQAHRLCDRGSCATGKCRGHVDVTDWRLVETDEQRFTCEFSAEFYCRCE